MMATVAYFAYKNGWGADTPFSWRQLGNASIEVAIVLMGKHRPEYTPHVDSGDFVIVTKTGEEFADDESTYNFSAEHTRQRFSGAVNWVKLDLGSDAHDHLVETEDAMRVAMSVQ